LGRLIFRENSLSPGHFFIGGEATVLIQAFYSSSEPINLLLKRVENAGDLLDSRRARPMIALARRRMGFLFERVPYQSPCGLRYGTSRWFDVAHHRPRAKSRGRERINLGTPEQDAGVPSMRQDKQPILEAEEESKSLLFRTKKEAGYKTRLSPVFF